MISPSPTGTSEAEELVKALKERHAYDAQYYPPADPLFMRAAKLIERMASALEIVTDHYRRSISSMEEMQTRHDLTNFGEDMLRKERQFLTELESIALNHGRTEHG